MTAPEELPHSYRAGPSSYAPPKRWVPLLIVLAILVLMVVTYLVTASNSGEIRPGTTPTASAT